LRLEIKFFPYNLIIYNFFSEYAIRELELFKMSILLKGYIFYLTVFLNGELRQVKSKKVKYTGVITAYSFISGSRKHLKPKKSGNNLIFQTITKP
jgi:hypothetical protein